MTKKSELNISKLLNIKSVNDSLKNPIQLQLKR